MNSDNIIQFQTEIDKPVRLHVDFDMRTVVNSSHKRFVIPASAKIDYVLTQVGILSVSAEWSSLCDFEITEGIGTNQIHLIPADKLSLIPSTLTIMDCVTTIDFDGRKFYVMIGNEDREYCFTTILSAKWRDGGFVFEQTVKLPPMENFIAAHTMPIHVEGESVANTLFVVYLNFDADDCSESAVVGIQQFGDTADVVVYRDGEKVKALAHAQLTEIVTNFSDEDYL